MDTKFAVLADVGNTAIKLALLHEGTMVSVNVCASTIDIGEFIRSSGAGLFAYSSVRPSFTLNEVVSDSSPTVIDARDLLEFSPVSFPSDLDIGLDRKLACIAASACLESSEDRAMIVVTAGTATTVSVIMQDRCVSSFVWPGLGASIRAINAETRISVERLAFHRSHWPEDVPSSLSDSVRMGVLMSTSFAIEGWAAKCGKIYGKDPTVVLTGGYSATLARSVSMPVVPRPDLTLEGIAFLLRESQAK